MPTFENGRLRETERKNLATFLGSHLALLPYNLDSDEICDLQLIKVHIIGL